MRRLLFLPLCLLLTACDQDCQCENPLAPSPTPSGVSCLVGPPVLSDPKVNGRTVTATWTPASAQMVFQIEEESGAPGRYIPVSRPVSVSSAAGVVTFVFATDGRFKIRGSTECGSSERIVLVTTQPTPEPPPPPPPPPPPVVPPCLAWTTKTCV